MVCFTRMYVSIVVSTDRRLTL